jgi:hypothetical protein
MKIPVRSTPDKFFIQVLGLMSNFMPIKELRPKEKRVLAEILYQHYRFRDNPERNRVILIFSSEVRKDMRDRLGMSDATFSFNLSMLRKKGVLGKDNYLPKFLAYIMPTGDTFDFTVSFMLIKEDE